MFYRFYFFTILFLGFAVGCDSRLKTNNTSSNSNGKSNANPQFSNTANVENKVEYKIKADIYGDKNGVGIRTQIDEENSFDVDGIRFNNQELRKIIEENIVEYRGSMLPFQKENELIIETKDGKQQLFKIPFEPLDFAVEEPFEFHKTTSNTLKISKVYDSTTELWLAIYDNYTGVFKEIAEFNETKDAIVISESIAYRMSVGDSKISLYDVRFGRIESQSRLFPIKYTTSYESQIKLKVVR